MASTPTRPRRRVSAQASSAAPTSSREADLSFHGSNGTPSRDDGVIVLLVPSVTDINGAGGVAARWREYSLELEREGYGVELWTVDSQDEATKIPRYHLANFPDTLTDSPGAGFVWKLWNRVRRRKRVDPSGTARTPSRPRVRAVIMTDLFSNVPLALVCASAGVPLIYSIHTDIAQLDGVNLLPSSAAFLQANAARLASACVTTSPSFMKTLQKRGIRWCDRYYRPLPVCGVVEASEKCAAGEIRATRRELTGDHPERPLLVYVGRWSAEKRMHLLKRCRPSGATLAFVGDGPMREVVERWHDPPRVVVSPGMRKRNDLARVYRAADWVVSASAFETFGNVPYEAAHCGTPALLQDAQGFTDQIDGANEDRGALVKFDSPIPEGEIAVSEAMDRTRVLLSDPDRVRDAARRAARDGVTIAQIVSEVLREEPVAEVRRRIGRFEIPKNPLRRTLAERLRRCERFFFAFLWAIQLAVILTVVKAVMIGCMRVGVDFTTGMAHQRGAKKRRRRGRSPGAAEDSGAPRFSGGGLGERGERRDAKRADAEDAADAADAAPADGEDVLDATLPPSPARVLTRPLQPYV